MAVDPNRPVLFLAFANDRSDGSRYLRNLAEEARAIYETLRIAERAGHCEIQLRQNITPKQLFDLFQEPDYHGRIALFHFGGHANSYQLTLETSHGKPASAYAGGLAAFLAEQPGLRIVFLNGCSTKQQIQGLLDAGVAAVIATTQAINDQTATAFATRFYRALVAGDTLQSAYNQALAAIQTERADDQPADLVGSNRHLRPLPAGATEADQPRWLLRSRPDKESVLALRLLDLRPSPWPTLDELPLDLAPDVGPLPPGSRLELAPNPLFIGREQELHKLAAALKPGNTVLIAAATGTGGIGKTQLAIEFAHRYGRFFTGGVFWLNFATSEGVPAEVVACGLNMAERPAGFEAAPQEEQLRWVRQVWQSPVPRLLIFDNCEAPALLTQWRPATGGCRILVTSRRSNWERTLGLKLLPLDTLPRDQSIHLLCKFVAPEDESVVDASIADHQSPLHQIAAELGDLPLALHLAGGYLALYQHTVTPTAYLSQLRSPGLLHHRSLRQGGHSPTGHEQNVARTFALSYERLDITDPIDALALRLLARAARFAPNYPIPRHLLLASVGVENKDIDAADALHRLADLGLLDFAAKGHPRLHRLLAHFVQAASEESDTQADVEKAVYQGANRLNGAGYPVALLPWQPHLRFVTDQAITRCDEQAARLCSVLDFHLSTLGDLRGARPYSEQALAIRRRVLGEQHPHTAKSLNNLGYLLHAQGEFEEARSYLEQALAIRQRVLGEQHPDTAQSLNNLGYLLHAQGEFEKARSYYEQALAIRQRVLGEQHPHTAKSLNNLGVLLHAQGEFEKARSYYEQALAIRRRVLGEQHPDTAQSLNNLGFLLRAQDEFEKARSYFEQALAINRQVLGKQHPTTVFSLNNLGVLLHAQGEFEKARSYYEQALAIFGPRLGSPQSYTQIVRNNLATLDAV